MEQISRESRENVAGPLRPAGVQNRIDEYSLVPLYHHGRREVKNTRARILNSISKC